MIYEHKFTTDPPDPPIHFTYYPRSGGVVVLNDRGTVLDAGVIREPGVITARELQVWSLKWLLRTAECRNVREVPRVIGHMKQGGE